MSTSLKMLSSMVIPSLLRINRCQCILNTISFTLHHQLSHICKYKISTSKIPPNFNTCTSLLITGSVLSQVFIFLKPLWIHSISFIFIPNLWGAQFRDCLKDFRPPFTYWRLATTCVTLSHNCYGNHLLWQPLSEFFKLVIFLH